MGTPNNLRTVYRRTADGKLVDPAQMRVWVPQFEGMYTKLRRNRKDVAVAVQIDQATTSLYYEYEENVN